MTTTRFTFVSHTAAPGGAELALSRYLRLTALPVELVTMRDGPVWEDLPCPVTTAPTLLRLARVLRDGDGPVIANSMRVALLCALLLPRRRALVYWVRDGLTSSAMSTQALVLTKAITSRKARAYLANSRWTAGTVCDALGVDPSQVKVVPSLSGVTQDGIASPRPRMPDHPPRILYLGRLARWKGPDVAVRMLPLLRARGVDATLTIAGAALFGEHEYAAELSELVDRTHGAEMVGHVEDVAALVAEHDLLVHCSRVPEPFGQVLVQALAGGLPVVATRGGGPAETLVGAPVPLLYEPGDAQGLASRVTEVLPHYAGLSSWAVFRALQYRDSVLAGRTDEALLAAAHGVNPPNQDRRGSS